MFDIEKNRCDYFIAYPCDCGKHYETLMFMKSEEFIDALGKVCKKFETETSIRDFPLLGGIGFGDELPDYYIYKVGCAKPQRIKWVGDATLATLIRDKDKDEGKCSAVVAKKNMKIVRSTDTNIFYKKCLERVELPGGKNFTD